MKRVSPPESGAWELLVRLFFAQRANLPPVAVNDSAAIATITPVTIVVLANDSDPDHDPLRVAAVTQGAKGSVAVNADGSLTYTPGARFKTSDSFGYSISDGHGGTASATVTVQKSSGGKSKPGV